MLTPPNDEKAELAVLGSIIIENGVLPLCQSIINKDHFYVKANAEIFSDILALYEKKTPIDFITLNRAMSDNNRPDTERLLACTSMVADCSHAEYYAKIVAKLYYEREIINNCRRLATEQDNSYLQKITALVTAKIGLEGRSLFEYKRDLYGFLEELTKEKKSDIYNTGFIGLDGFSSGIKAGEINTWCAATNVGKSIMLLNLMNKAAKQGQKCLYIGTEMSSLETVQRHLSIVSKVEAWKIRSARMGDIDITKAHNALADTMCKMGVNILDSPEPGIRDIEGAIASSGAEIVFLDYLERFTLPREESLRLRIREFMRQLKTIARTKNVVIHLASQLNRMAYDKEDSKPTMAQISESSAVEKESDRIVLMWTPKSKQLDGVSVLECIMAKNRHGRRNIVFDMHLNHDTLEITEGINVSKT